MSAEFFETVMTADARTAPDGRGIEWAEPYCGEPRALVFNTDSMRVEFNPDVEHRGRAWCSVKVYAHDALAICADTLRNTEMTGLSGDYKIKRQALANIIEHIGLMTRYLALDAACDGAVTPAGWTELMQGLDERFSAAWLATSAGANHAPPRS